MTNKQKRRAKEILKTVIGYHTLTSADGVFDYMTGKVVTNKATVFEHDSDLHEELGGNDPQCHTLVLCRELLAMLEEE